MKKIGIALMFFFIAVGGFGQLRWSLSKQGGIFWKISKPKSHSDHIEMSGKQISSIITYGIDTQNHLILNRKLIFPMLRTIPNNTRASLIENMNQSIIDSLKVNGQQIRVQPKSFYINGYLCVHATINMGLEIQMKLFPSMDKAAYIEGYQLTNNTSSPVSIWIPAIDTSLITQQSKGVYGSYVVNLKVYHSGYVLVQAGETIEFSAVFSARKQSEDPYYYSFNYEFDKRKRFIQEVTNSLVLKTPNDTINQMFSFAKIRVAESIFDTKGGLMHGPGGGDYYAAIWANDQAEYASPFFPFLGYQEGNESARNCYRLFATYMNKEYKPIPSSIIAEGADIWHGAGDRGDQAMIAYGASRFALADGDRIEADRLWPLISWCLEYLERKKTVQGVISSNSDELEGRFAAGKVNLSTNCLAYSALNDASKLAEQLGKTDTAKIYKQRAIALGKNIELYFGANIQGYNTYRYYEGNTVLRSWICLPLVVGLWERKTATLKALLSKYLWSKNGILTEAGSKTYWDRATLYTFRGLFYAAETDTSYQYFKYYSAMRLLGEHVPYAVEAWPEGDQRHLSAESGLYCRVITEGLFGIEPMGFHSFRISPWLPKNWNEMTLSHIKAFDSDFEIHVKRFGSKEKISIRQNGKADIIKIWDRKNPILIDLGTKKRL